MRSMPSQGFAGDRINQQLFRLFCALQVKVLLQALQMFLEEWAGWDGSPQFARAISPSDRAV